MPLKSLQSWSTAQSLPVTTQNAKSAGRELMAPLLTARQASEYLQVPVTTLAVWRCTGRVSLPSVKLGPRQVRYRREDLEAFVTARAGLPGESIPRRASKPKASAAAGRLEEFTSKHDTLQCERCDEKLKAADARIASHLELPGIDGPRDPHDWHCFCPSCFRVLSELPAVQTVNISAPSYGLRA